LRVRKEDWKKKKGKERKKIFIIMVLLLLVQQVFAQEKTEQSATDLAKKTQNPVADLISLPFQFNTFFETGPTAKIDIPSPDKRL
jgi:hypothetical protein